MEAKVCIVLVNYKTWMDTLECMESILKSNYTNYQIVVVENGSEGNDWEQLLKWARGEASISVQPDNPLFRLSHPHAPKPVLYHREKADDITELRLGNLENIMPVLFVRSEVNRGFAGGNNVGIRYAMQNQFDYVWLLNNDTVIEPDAIHALVDYCEAKKLKKQKVGIVGSKLMVYHKPDRMQGVGAVFNKYSGKSRIIGAQQVDTGQFDHMEIRCNYVIGAAMFVSNAFLLDVGLMSEEYFLYNEENDWSARAKKHGYAVGVAVQSKVYHKQGASTGNSPKKSKWQLTALQYKYRGKIKLYKKYYPLQLPFLYLHLFRRSIKYLVMRNFAEAKVIYAAMFHTKFQK
ncbi:MAG: glycosyltransferase family 2 protein [Chitinophagales bacterium]